MCSPEQIRTADFQLRRLTFYPAELRDRMEGKTTE